MGNLVVALAAKANKPCESFFFYNIGNPEIVYDTNISYYFVYLSTDLYDKINVLL